MKKKIILSAIAGVALLSSFAAAPVKSEETVAREVAAVVLDKAVTEGIVSESEKTRFMQSGIIEEATRTLMTTNFDVAAAVDNAAEKAVQQGYFKSKKQAKQTLRNALEQARRSETLWQKAYRMMGI